jgi:hypothetical protein
LGDFVRRVLPLADDPFQIHLDDFFEKQTAIVFNMIEVEHAGTLTPNHPFQHRLSFNQWERSKVLTIQIKQVERDKDALAGVF